MSLTQDVYRAFKDLKKNYAFIPAKPIGGSRHAAFVRLIDSDLLVSVMVQESNDEMADVNIWLSPLDVPDGAVENLNVGYNIWIGSDEMPVSEEFLKACEQRIITLLPSIPALIPPLRKELKKPAIKSLKWKAFQHQEELRAIVQSLADQSQAEAKAALGLAIDYANGKLRLSDFSEACLRLSKEVLSSGELSKRAYKFYEGDAERVNHAMYRMLFAWGLGELSRRKQEKHS